MWQAQQERRAVLIVEDDAEVRGATVALLEDGQVDTIECESAEAALAVMLMGGREVALIFADVRLPGAMDGIDLAWEAKARWPHLPIISYLGTSTRSRQRHASLGHSHAQAVAATQGTDRRRRSDSVCGIDRAANVICTAEELRRVHSITSSARASSVGGTSRPSALAVLRLITSSYLVGACTGRSAGFSPLRMRST